MPEFIAEHVPADVLRRTRRGAGRANRFACFLAGYFEAAEWLWPDPAECEEGFSRNKVRGWSRSAQRAIAADCRDFFRAEYRDLARYVGLRCRRGADPSDMWRAAGTDFYLSREGHGAGYFDRGDDSVSDRLQESAQGQGAAGSPYLHRGYVHFI